jgi:hypothetical protein
MSMINDIALHIMSCLDSSWQLGINVFIGHLPLKDMNGAEVGERLICILERTPGEVDGYIADYAAKNIQVWNQARDYPTASADANELFECLHGEAGVDLPASDSPSRYLAMSIDAIGTPAPIANPNPEGLIEFSTNYVFRIERNPTASRILND